MDLYSQYFCNSKGLFAWMIAFWLNKRYIKYTLWYDLGVVLIHSYLKDITYISCFLFVCFRLHMGGRLNFFNILHKVNSVQEACAKKCYAVHILDLKSVINKWNLIFTLHGIPWFLLFQMEFELSAWIRAGYCICAYHLKWKLK